MKFLSVILLLLFISVNSSASTQDGTFHKNGKTNVKPPTATQDGTFHENAKTNVNSSTATEDGTFHENAKRNGNAGLNVVLRNDAKEESQLTRFRRSLYSLTVQKECYRYYFVGNRPPTGLLNLFNSYRYICQGVCSIPDIVDRGCFSTLYDLTDKIPIYSAYVLRPKEWMNIGISQRIGLNWRKEAPNYKSVSGSPDPDIRKINKNIDSMYSNTRDLPCIHKGHLVPAETYSFSDAKIRSTFVYTNAVPQYQTFNSGEWSIYEKKIRVYGKDKCAKSGGDLYLLTGISDRQILGKNEKGISYGIPVGTPKQMPLEPNIVIPNSMWTAGCCVKSQTVLGAFAVIGNNDPIKENIYMSKVTVKKLEEIIGKGVIWGITKLFPGNDDCNDIKYDVKI